MSLPNDSHADNAIQQLIAITNKTTGVQRSMLDRYFWPIAFLGVIGVPLITLGLLWGLATLIGPRPGIPSESILTVSPLMAKGPTDLCPGEPLDFEFTMDVRGEGVFDLDASTWKLVPPPETVIFSESERFVVAEPITYLVMRRWVVPSNYIDPATNRATEWQSGQYERQIFVTAVGRDTEPSIQVLPFTIRNNCK